MDISYLSNNTAAWMTLMDNRINPKVFEIANTLKNAFLDSLQTENLVSIFLCGGNSIADSKFRRHLGNEISTIHSKYQYSVYYPEDMFIELILGHQRKDLLSLEDLLAKGVHCVVILVQSPGTLTELGAFTNYPDLKDRLVVVIDPSYKLKRSFIALGPLRYLKTQTKSKVIYSTMNEQNLDDLTRQIAEASREIAKHSTPSNDLSNPIASQKFFLSMIFVFDPISRFEFIKILKKMTTCEPSIALTVAEAVLNGLINERKALSVGDRISITNKGIDALIFDSVLKTKSRHLLSFLSSLRLEALNITLRKRYIKMGGAADA
jgi:hypothetical protein